MPTITIKRRHKLEPKKAKAAAQRVIKDLSARYQLACRGTAIRLNSSDRACRPHASRKNEVLLDVQPRSDDAAQGPIERAINEELDRLFGIRPEGRVRPAPRTAHRRRLGLPASLRSRAS
jgi:hypothetical protein